MTNPIVLIADDEPANLAVLNQVLGSTYAVRVCKSGEQVLRLAATSPQPDLILLDVVMPGMDGYQVLQALREDPHTSGIPVIFATALDDEVDEERGLLLGAEDYITKPIRPAVVHARVKAQLEISRTRAGLKRQKEALLREVYHRVRNNLNVMSSLLSLHAGRIERPDDAVRAFEDARRRIMAMAAVHQEVYESPDHGSIDMKEFVERLATHLVAVHSDIPVQLTVAAQHVLVGVETAVPCGMVLSELVDNAMRHAVGTGGGSVRVELSATPDEHAALIVADSGPGTPKDAQEADTMGFTLVNLWAQQVGGSFQLESGNGSEFGTVSRLSFPIRVRAGAPEW